MSNEEKIKMADELLKAVENGSEILTINTGEVARTYKLDK